MTDPSQYADADYFVTAIDAVGRATLVNAKTGDEITDWEFSW